MQSATSRVWTRVAVSISFDDNYYTTAPPLSVIFLHDHSPDMNPAVNVYKPKNNE